MNDLFPLDLAPMSLQSPRLRLVPVMGDGMAPALRPHQDFALCLPVTAYDGEGVYLLLDRLGGQDFWRAEATLAGPTRVRLTRDNQHYADQLVSDEWFNEAVLAKVVADVKVRAPRQLQEACNG